MFDPIIQVLRPISPLAWLPLGLVLFQKSEPAALFAIAVCSMWPTVHQHDAGRARDSAGLLERRQGAAAVAHRRPSSKILVPATLPYMFTGYRLSLGIAWLVIVASEMLTGTPGVGGFLWQEYNSLIYAHILLAILTIGVVGFVLDRLMGAGRSRGCGRCEPMAFIEVSRRLEVVRHRRRRASTCCDDVNLDGRARRVRRRSSASWAAASRRCSASLAGLTAARRRQRRGRRRAGDAACARDAAFVFQNYSLLPWFTALENVRLAVAAAFPRLAARAAARAGARATSSWSASATRSTGGPASSRAACGSGWRSRARLRPSREMLFLDEPFGALDALTRDNAAAGAGAALCATASGRSRRS